MSRGLRYGATLALALVACEAAPPVMPASEVEGFRDSTRDELPPPYEVMTDSAEALDLELGPEDTGDADSADSSSADIADIADSADGSDSADNDVGTDSTDATADTGEPVPSDLIYGVSVPRASSWWVERGRFHRGTRTVRLRGVNWFGLETPDRALHGTWFGRTVEDLLAELRRLGFDSLRVPVSPESINPGFPAAWWAATAFADGTPVTGREHLELLVEPAAAADFSVLLDFHSCDPTRLGTALPGRPDGCLGYDVARWLADLTALAALARDHEHVLGIDLVNEPHALTWSAWKLLVEQAAEAILRESPRLLVFVEGVAGLSPFGDAYPFWGENLTEAAADPPDIPPSRLVFSPHTYGPGVGPQSYFDAAGFPANMPAIWHAHFGYLVPQYAVAVGEFGGFYDDARAPGEVAWNDAFVAWLATLDRGRPASFYYWAVNPNSEDTGGLFEDDWKTVSARRLDLLAPLLVP